MGREMGERFKREGICVYLWLIHVDVWQKTQFCKAIIFQLNNKFKIKGTTKGQKMQFPVESSRVISEPIYLYCAVLVTQSCPTLCDPMDCSPPGSSVHGDFPGKSTGVGCHAILQGIFPNQGSNPGLLHYRWILYHLSHQGSPYVFIKECQFLLQVF